MNPEYPQTRNLADLASANAQRKYLIATVAQLVLLLVAALISGIGSRNSDNQRLIAWGVCVTMFFALISSFVLKTGRFEVKWFKCRAYAENAKSLVWKFVMSDNQHTHLNEDKFLEDWINLEKRLHEVHTEFALSSPESLTTPWMVSTLALDLHAKTIMYRKLRLQDQLDWYSTNANRNAARHEKWFWVVFFIEAATILSAGLQAWLLPQVNLVGFIVSMSTGALVWSQVKRFSDLSTTYSVAAEDLRQISFKYRDVPDQITLDRFVEDVEEAVSREHSLWLSKRVGHC